MTLFIGIIMQRKKNIPHQWCRYKKADIIRKVIRTVCVYHSRPILSESLMQVAIDYITTKLPVREMKRLQKNENDRAFVQAMLLATPFVT